MKYPATLITTGEEDSRVDPCHARKYAARLQAASTNEVLLRGLQHFGPELLADVHVLRSSYLGAPELEA